MTPAEFKARQTTLGLKNADMARLCRVSIRTVEKWRQGSRSVPGPVRVVLDLCRKYKGAVKYLLAEYT